LAHLNRFEFEKTKQTSNKMRQRAEEIINLWKELVKDKQYRLANDSLQYYTEGVDLLLNGGGLLFDVGMRASLFGIGDNMEQGLPMHRAKFMDKNDIKNYVEMLLDSSINRLDGKYF
jgi:hypothetical protein